MSGRLAVVLFNLGGPDSLEAVEPFLFNLFNDEAIIGVPALVRGPLARFIAKRRANVAKGIYEHLGGASPLLPLTREQATALERRLEKRGYEVRVFVCMRYWHPRSEQVTAAVRSYNPQDVVLLPLYPQFSTTTTASSLADWGRAASAAGLSARTHCICCYPTNSGWIDALTDRIRDSVDQAALAGPFRLLFSAHGLPKRVIARGDPYQWQVEQTTVAVLKALQGTPTDHVVCYQSRVGPLQWIGPSLDDELARAARDGVAAVVVPVSFVSEHSETLVELDIEYRNRAYERGVPAYLRVPTVGTADEFVAGLADLIEHALSATSITITGASRPCPASFGRCALWPAAALQPDSK